MTFVSVSKVFITLAFIPTCLEHNEVLMRSHLTPSSCWSAKPPHCHLHPKIGKWTETWFKRPSWFCCVSSGSEQARLSATSIWWHDQVRTVKALDWISLIWKRDFKSIITVEQKNSLNSTINNHKDFNVNNYKIYNTSYTVYILPIQCDLFNFGMTAPQQMFNLQIIHVIQSRKPTLYMHFSFTYRPRG